MTWALDKMTKYTVNLIGTGRLGTTLAYLLANKPTTQLLGLYNLNPTKAEHIVHHLGEGRVYSSLGDLPRADLTFITTPDDCIQKTSRLLSTHQTFTHQVIAHCSGIHASSILSDCQDQGAHIASIHPMLSVSCPQLARQHFPGTYCAIEGDATACQMLEPLFHALGAILYPIRADKKAMYHAAGVFATNYVTTLAHTSRLCLVEAGVEGALAQKIVHHMMKQNINQLEHTVELNTALTGPLQRGDYHTITQHLQALTTPAHALLYKTLGRSTLALTGLNECLKKKMLALFD